MSGPRVLGDYVSGPSVKRMLSPPFSLIHKATYIMMQPHEMRSGNRYAQQAQARRTLQSLDAGPLEEFTLRAESLTLVVRVLTQEYFLACAVLPSGSLGKARYLMRMTAPALSADL